MRGAGSKRRCYSCIDWEMTGRFKKKHPNSSSGPNFDHHLGLCLHNQPEWVGMDGLEGDGGSTVVCTGYGGWRPHFRKSEQEKQEKTSRVDVWGKRQVLPQIVGKISFALMWKVDCFCCFNRTMLENIGVWTREWIDYICCSKIFGAVAPVDQVVNPFQGKCHVNM